MVNFFDFSKQELEEYFIAQGDKPFRARQIMRWIYKQGVTDFNLMTDVGKKLREHLLAEAILPLPEKIIDQRSEDGTHKWLFRLQDGNAIETVFIPETDRGTLCVSSQVGCTLNCNFCATARQGFNRNLTTAEIISQIFVAYHQIALEKPGVLHPITNVVFMGMGEPLLNFDAVVKVCNLVMDDLAFGLGKRRVTISTAGVVPAILRLQAVTDVSLAISLHASEDNLRSELMPINKKYPIKELLEACKVFVKNAPHKRITFEYVLLQDINDTLQQAKDLINLLKDIPSKVNLIPFNPFPNSDYKRSSTTRVYQFRDILLANGLMATVRKTRGDDIDAACGQLVGRVHDKSSRTIRFRSIEV